MEVNKSKDKPHVAAPLTTARTTFPNRAIAARLIGMRSSDDVLEKSSSCECSVSYLSVCRYGACVSSTKIIPSGGCLVINGRLASSYCSISSWSFLEG